MPTLQALPAGGQWDFSILGFFFDIYGRFAAKMAPEKGPNKTGRKWPRLGENAQNGQKMGKTGQNGQKWQASGWEGRGVYGGLVGDKAVDTKCVQISNIPQIIPVHTAVEFILDTLTFAWSPNGPK